MAAAYDLLVRLLVECEGDVVPSKEVWKVPLPRYKSAVPYIVLPRGTSRQYILYPA